MGPKQTHSWNVSISEAIEIQNRLRQQIVSDSVLPENITKIAGIDTGFEGPEYEIARAVVAILSFPNLELIEYKIAKRPVEFPYVPGFLSFREGPAIIDAFEKIENEPDLLIFDGHGSAHPRRMGIAAHLGVLFDKPSIGCGKSKLFGKFEPLTGEVGSSSYLMDKDEVIGKVILTKKNTNPIIVSAGHKINLKDAVEFVRLCTKPKLKLPETTNWAHKLASQQKHIS